MKWSRIWTIVSLAVFAHVALLFLLRGCVLAPSFPPSSPEPNFSVVEVQGLWAVGDDIVEIDEIHYTVSTDLVEVGDDQDGQPSIQQDFFGLPRKAGSVTIVWVDGLFQIPSPVRNAVRREIETALASRGPRENFNLISGGREPATFNHMAVPANDETLQEAFLFLSESEPLVSSYMDALQVALSTRPTRIVLVTAGGSIWSQAAVLSRWERMRATLPYEVELDVVGIAPRPQGRSERTLAALASSVGGNYIRWVPVP